jgi:mono/diheme cytochrome c family protein
MNATVKLFAAVAFAMALCSAVQADDGKEAYQRCVVCHQPDGSGIPGVFPALKDRLAPIMETVEGREYVTMVLAEGLIGTISIEGQTYMGAMPAQGLTDAQIAAVLNYIVAGFGDAGATEANNILSEEEVAGIRSKYSGADAKSTLDLRAEVPALN